MAVPRDHSLSNDKTNQLVVGIVPSNVEYVGGSTAIFSGTSHVITLVVFFVLFWAEFAHCMSVYY